MEMVSDEDFMTQLSSDLDIPLLLNPGEDEMAVLNSFLDKTPDEILSDLGSSDYVVNDMDIEDSAFLNGNNLMETNIQIPNNMGKSISKRIVSESSVDSSILLQAENSITYFDYLNGALNSSNLDYFDVKLEEHSDESCSSRNSLEPSTPPPILSNKKLDAPVLFPNNILPKSEIVGDTYPTVNQAVRHSNKSMKFPIKRVPIKPKTCAMPAKNPNIVFIKNVKTKFPNFNIKEAKNGTTNVSSNIVLLDSVQVNSFNTLTSAFNHINNPVSSPSISIYPGGNIDPKILKRQERKIKNRESASISRKKKKDYLNSLEEQVKELMAENKRLITENTFLRERLSCYENGSKISLNHIPSKAVKPALVLCAFLLVLGLNLNISSSPFLTKVNQMDPGSNNFPRLPDHYGRNLLWAREDYQEDKLKNNTYFSPLTMCPASINQSESARLLLELEKWIGKPEHANNITIPVKSPSQKPKTRRKKLRIDSSVAQVRRREPHGDVKNEIQVFSPNSDQLYSEFFEAINRQDDTFYVVSFSEQHMLLPALYHNKTRRPKMSLLMPSVFPNETTTQTYIPLMQIDCEVLDTKLVNVKYGSIPRPYRHYGNFSKENNSSKRNSSYSPRKYDSKKAYKPYFLSKHVLKAVDFK